MDQVSYVLEFTINEGRLDDFKEKAQGYAEAVEANEPNTVAYEWFLSEDGKHCLLYETFTDSDALMTHLKNVGPSLPDLLVIAPISRWEVMGDVSAEARTAMADFGANHFHAICGFERGAQQPELEPIHFA